MMFKKTCVVSVLLLLMFLSQKIKADDITYDEPEGIVYLSLVRKSETVGKGLSSEIFNYPGNITVIGKNEIRSFANTPTATVADVLRYAQGVFVRDYFGHGKSVSVDLRGFGETGPSNTLVLVNGRRTNNIDMANVDWTQIPLESVEKIEIIRGPSAVLYGDNATGGVINIITRKGIGDTLANIGAEIGSFYASKLKIGLSGSKDNVCYNIIANRNSTEGHRENSAAQNNDINAFVVCDLPGVKASLDMGYHTDKYGLPGALSESDWKSGKLAKASTPLNEAKTNDSYIQIAVGTPLTEKLKNVFSVSMRNRLASSYWRNSYDPIWFPNPGEDRKTDTIGIGNKVYFENPKIGSIIGGIEVYSSKQAIKSLDKNDIPVPGSTDIKKDSIALYINDDIKLLSEKLYLTAGARWELANYSFASTGKDELKISSSAQAYSLGASYLFDDKTSVHAKWSSAFRTPTVDEYYSVRTGLNADLKFQNTRTTELGGKKIFSKKFSGNLSVFQTDTENEIYYNPATFSNENYKKTSRLGAELGLSFNPIKPLDFSVNYTYTDGKITEGLYKNSVIPAVPAHSGSAIGNLRMRENLGINVAANYVGERYFISDQKNISPKMPAYVIFNAGFSYKMKSTKIFGGVGNIFDEKYAEYGVANIDGTARNYYPSPGRNFFAGMEVVF